MAPLFSSGSRFFPSYFKVVGRSHKFAFIGMHDLSLTPDVIDVDPKMAFDVASHGLAAGHATPGLDVVTPGLLGWFFFNLFSCFSMGFLGFLELGSPSSASDDVWESKSSLLLGWGGAHP